MREENEMAEDFWEKAKTQFLHKLVSHINNYQLDVNNDRILVVGASIADYNILVRAGFKNITLSNLSTAMPNKLEQETNITNLVIDAEDMYLADQSYDVVFAYDVLHHCRSPHCSLCEMMRVAKKYVIFMEPNDSFLMSILVKFGFSFPYELSAVVNNNYIKGGVRDSCVPNYIYRWDRSEVLKTASAYLTEYQINLCAYSYWDFTLTEKMLLARDQTKLAGIAKIIGPSNFLKLLKILESVLNRIPLVKTQGNKFFCIISKTNQLHPWLNGLDSSVKFNREFGQKSRSKPHSRLKRFITKIYGKAAPTAKRHGEKL